jgi:hypothetical protein
MMVKGRSTTALCLSVISFLFTPAIAKQESSNLPISPSSNSVRLTCNRDAIDLESYEMATIGQARALLTDRSDFWDAFRINRHIATLRDPNLDAQELAERNPDLDGRWDSHSEPYKNVRGIRLGPWDYHRRIRDMLLRFAEPSDHIKRTSAGRGAGW